MTGFEEYLKAAKEYNKASENYAKSSKRITWVIACDLSIATAIYAIAFIISLIFPSEHKIIIQQLQPDKQIILQQPNRQNEDKLK